MKKQKEGKENRRNGANFFKYVQPQSSLHNPQSKLHSRSLIDLDANTNRYQQSARVAQNKQSHHSSLTNQAAQVESNTVKSHSLKKFLSIFGGPADLSRASGSRTSGIQQKHSAKGSGRQVFTCNIKNMNVNMTTNKEKEHRQGTILIKKNKNESANNSMNTKRNGDSEVIDNLKKIILEGKERELNMKQNVDKLKNENCSLRRNIESSQEERQSLAHNFKERESNMLKKIDLLEKTLASRQKCREHQLIIESLKKVINEQLKKIIELQKMKVEKQEIQRLEERISKNINMVNQNSAKEKLKMMEDNDLLKMNRKRWKTIKIQDESLSQQSIFTPKSEFDVFSDAIEEAPQSEERDPSSEDRDLSLEDHNVSFEQKNQCSFVDESQGDSILEEVDKYLTQWRKRC